jgi:hypothetical protein
MPTSTPSARRIVVGPCLPSRRRLGHSPRRDLVAEQRDAGEVAGTLAGDACSELYVADPADLGDAVDALDCGACLRLDAAAHERGLSGVGVHDGVCVLRPDRAGRRGDQAVEQAAEEHQQDGDQREDHRRRREPAGASP